MAEIKGGQRMLNKLAELSAQLGKPASLKVGFLAGATYPDGTPVAMVAAIQEYGAPKARIPPRMGFRNMVREKSASWPKGMAAQLKAGNSIENTLAITGEVIAGQIRQKIIQANSPPLRPITLMLRKMQSETPGLVVTGRTVGEAARRVAAGESTGGVSTKPLVWSSNLLNSVSYEVNV